MIKRKKKIMMRRSTRVRLRSLRLGLSQSELSETPMTY